MLRDLARRVARRLVDGSPRIPHAPASGHKPAEHRSARASSPPPSPPVEAVEEPLVELEASAVAARLAQDPQALLLIDIREPHELRQGHLRGAWLMPMNSIPDALDQLPRDRSLALYCAAGVRSFGVAHYLREQGFDEAWSVPGGFGDLVHQDLPWTHPPADAPFRLLQRVQREGDPTAGQVQAIEATAGGGWQVAVLYPGPAGGRWVPGIPHEQLRAARG